MRALFRNDSAYAGDPANGVLSKAQQVTHPMHRTAIEGGLVCLRELVSEDLVAELAVRSKFICTQVRCIGDGGDVGAVKVPARAGKLWVACLLRSDHLRVSADTTTLVQFLKVPHFFWYMRCCFTVPDISNLREAVSKAQIRLQPPLRYVVRIL